MRFSWNFLKEFFSPFCTPQELAQRLTMAGMEVEQLSCEGNDWIFDIEVTTNRYDWLSIVGIAREAAAVCGQRVVYREKKEKKLSYRQIKVFIENQQDCSLYVGRVFKNVVVKESPEWLKERLLHCGIGVVNNVVDITNYCMLKWGNPLHAFDLDKIEGDIYIRRARKGEFFVGLDNKERVLDERNLVIADTKKIIALAGVIGAKNTGVDVSTKRVFLEGAVFSPLAIRRSRRAAGIDTESSYRFERRVSEQNLMIASQEATLLIEKLCGGIYLGMVNKGMGTSRRRKSIVVSMKRMEKFLGDKIPLQESRRILVNLGFKCHNYKVGQLKVEIPSFRLDISRDVDVFEEIVRIYGYDKIKLSLPILPPKSGAGKYQFKKHLRNLLAGMGLHEIISFSLTAKDKEHLLAEVESIELVNPLRSQENALRTTLLLGMLEVAAHNINQQNRELRYFELANIYQKRDRSFKEQTCLSLGCVGEGGVFFLKGVIETLKRVFNLQGMAFEEVNRDGFSACALIKIRGRVIGYFGKVGKKICDAFDIKKDFAFAQIDTEALMQLKEEKVYVKINRFPYAFRDVSIALSREKKFEEIDTLIRETVGDYLKGYEVIDVYQGENITPGFLGLTLRIYYQASDCTLTSEEVDARNNRLREELGRKEGVILR